MNIWSIVLTAVVSSGLGGAIVTKLVTFYIEKTLQKKSEKDEARKEEKMEEQLMIREKERAEGRLLFWLYQEAIGQGNADQLTRAYNEFSDAEDKKKINDNKMAIQYRMREETKQ